MKTLEELREEIRLLDRQAVGLFEQRLELAAEIAEYKKKERLPIEDRDREKYLAESLKSGVPERFSGYVGELYGTVFSISKRYQKKIIESSFRAGLIGEKLAHSFSPELHALFAGYEYRLYEIGRDSLGDFFKSCPLDGFNVTVPYKREVLPYLAGLSPEARRTGAVNTVVRKKDGFYGYNTDCAGFRALLKSSGTRVRHKKVLILGTGGAAAAVRAVLEDEDAREIINISRTGENNYGNLGKHGDADIIINATPVGMFPAAGESKVDLSIFKRLSGVLDLVYNPLKTKLLYDAECRGIPCSNGLVMLSAQARESCGLFLGLRRVEKDAAEAARELSRARRNIVLAGMPGCGKTAVGRTLAKMLGRPFIDTDESVARETGMDIPEIFEKYSEEYFRTAETRAVRAACRGYGAVIALGGGAVEREENFYPIKQNSSVVYIERDTLLLSSDGRPLTLKYGARELYLRRAPLYEKLCDIKISADSGVLSTAEKIAGALRET